MLDEACRFGRLPISVGGQHTVGPSSEHTFDRRVAFLKSATGLPHSFMFTHTWFNSGRSPFRHTSPASKMQSFIRFLESGSNRLSSCTLRGPYAVTWSYEKISPYIGGWKEELNSLPLDGLWFYTIFGWVATEIFCVQRRTLAGIKKFL